MPEPPKPDARAVTEAEYAAAKAELIRKDRQAARQDAAARDLARATAAKAPKR